MALHLHTSNRLEKLAFKLADMVRSQPLAPLVPEKIVVQSRGMARWLALSLSGHLGVWANCDCPFPNGFLSEIFSKVLPDVSLASDGRETMTWRLMGLLAEVAEEPGFGELAGYLAGSDEQKRFLVAWQLADLFDQYLMYRPDLLLSWEQGTDSGFQAELWRRLLHMQAGPHRAILLKDCYDTLSNPGFDPVVLPSRVSVFGVSSLPPYHLKLFQALSHHIQVHFFLMNPCQGHWADIVSEKDALKISRSTGYLAEELYYETGNSLLAGFGRQGRDFFGLIHEFEGCVEDPLSLFEDPGHRTLLASVQNDILGPEEASLFPHDPSVDDSIVFYSCHSPMREVETLKDHLLGLFAQKPELKASDILVMTPDIETYGPLIQAVFEAGLNDPLRIPYSIADRGQRSGSRLLEAFFAVLDLADSRFEVTKVLGLLETEAIRKRFGIGERDLERIRKWLSEVAVRWGLDRQERLDLGLPGYDEFSWQAGIDRLLLGWAMAGGSWGQTFHGILPYEKLSGTDGQLLDRFLQFFDTLVAQTANFKQVFSLVGWAQHLRGLVEALFAENEDSVSELLVLRQVFKGLEEQQNLAGFAQEIGLQPVRLYLVKLLDADRSASGFLSGGVTFCAMLPMRAVPFKVVCLLGMNDGDYPRRSRRLSFDLMAKEPRPGDRSIRNDDRYLFLETLISAREQLYISFVGQSPRDNKERPPSVLVSGLIDYLAQKTGAREKVEQKNDDPYYGLVQKARLQPFDPDYYKPDSPLASYDRLNMLAARALLGARRIPQPFVTAPLAEPDASGKDLNLDELAGFFCHPVKWFCRNRLGIILPELKESLADQESFGLDALSRYQLSSDMTDWRLDGHALKDYLAIARAGGSLPPGALGEAFYNDIYNPVAAFAGRIERVLRGPLPDVPVDLAIGGFRISGRLSRIGQQAMIAFRPAKLKAKDLIRAWIMHLCLNMVAGDYPRQTLLIATDREFRLQPVSTAAAILGSLLDLYWQGQKQPLAFFPQTSLKLIEELHANKDFDVSLRRARKVWEGSGEQPGESADPYHELCFGEIDCLDHAFAEQASTFFAPLFESMEVM